MKAKIVLVFFLSVLSFAAFSQVPSLDNLVEDKNPQMIKISKIVNTKVDAEKLVKDVTAHLVEKKFMNYYFEFVSIVKQKNDNIFFLAYYNPTRQATHQLKHDLTLFKDFVSSSQAEIINIDQVEHTDLW